MTILDQILSIFLKKKKVGLALGGGVARGLAHIGVLKVLDKHKIPISFLAGTSSGALVSLFYAAGMHPETMEKEVQRLGWQRFIKIVLTRHGPVSTDEIKNFIVKRIGNINFSDLKIPFVAVASDLMTGQRVVLSEGNAVDAVAASCAFPGVFVPIRKDGALLVDGGLVDNVPTEVVKSMGADYVIAVDVVPAYVLDEEPDNVLQIFGRTIDLAMKNLSRTGRNLSNILIEPDIPKDVWHLDVDKADRLISCGEKAAKRAIPKIKIDLAVF